MHEALFDTHVAPSACSSRWKLLKHDGKAISNAKKIYPVNGVESGFDIKSKLM